MYKITLVLILLNVAMPLIAQQDTKLIQQVELLKKTMVDPEKTILDGLISDRLSYGHSSGAVDTKTQFIQNLVEGNSNFSTIDISDQTIIIHGKTAIVRHNLKGKTMDKGKAPGEVNLHIMTTWIKDGKHWKLLARQAVKRS